MQGTRWLLIDSSGAEATLQIGMGAEVLASAESAGREFSRRWPQLLRELMQSVHLTLREIAVIGVISGPGSFTGVRVGVAAAKGLCESCGAKLALLKHDGTGQRSPEQVLAVLLERIRTETWDDVAAADATYAEVQTGVLAARPGVV